MDSNKQTSWAGDIPARPANFSIVATSVPAGHPLLKYLAPAEQLMRSFRLTRTEAAFSELLMRGHSVAESATEMGISIHTARTHLRKVMMKTGTNRQSELVGLLLRTLMN